MSKNKYSTRAYRLGPESRYFLRVIGHPHIHGNIRFADTKAGFTVALATTLLAALLGAGVHKVRVASPGDWTLPASLGIVSLFLLAVSVVVAATAVWPRTSSPSEKGYLTSWVGIASLPNAGRFWAEMQDKSQRSLGEHLAHHIYDNATLCRTKYRRVHVSMAAALLGAGVGALTLLLR